MNETTKRFPRSLQEARPWDYPAIEHYKSGSQWHVGMAFALVCFLLSVGVLVAITLEWI